MIGLNYKFLFLIYNFWENWIFFTKETQKIVEILFRLALPPVSRLPLEPPLEVFFFLWKKFRSVLKIINNNPHRACSIPEHSTLFLRFEIFQRLQSFWSNRLTWQVFFCSMIAAFTTNIFNSAFSGFHYQGAFGLLKESNILFKSTLDILNNIIIFLPTVC